MTSENQSTVPVKIIDNDKIAGSANINPDGSFSYVLDLTEGGSHKIVAKADAQHSTPWTIVRTARKDVVQDFEIYANGKYPSGLDTQYINFTGEYDSEYLELSPFYPNGESPPRSLSNLGKSILTTKKPTHSITITYRPPSSGYTWQCHYSNGAIDERIYAEQPFSWITITFTHQDITSVTLAPFRTDRIMYIYKCLMTVED